MSFCTNCGSRSPDGSAFCSSCGAAVVPASVTAPVQFSAAAPAQGAATPWGKILVIVLVVILLLGATVIGGVVYVGYRVKKKANEVFHRDASDESKSSSSDDNKSSDSSGSDSQKSKNQQDNPLAGILGAIGGGQSTPMSNMAKGILEDAGMKNPDMPPDLIRNIPYSALTTPLSCPAGAEINVAQLAAGKLKRSNS